MTRERRNLLMLLAILRDVLGRDRGGVGAVKMRHPAFVITRPRYIFIRKGIGVFYSERDGHEVLRDETHWTKISGLWFNTPWGCLWFRFRRFNVR